MSELRSALEPLMAEVLPDVPDAQLEEDFAELHRIGELLELERLRRLGEIERRGAFRRDGHLSAAVWLTDRFGVGWGQARAATRTARALEQMPVTRTAVRNRAGEPGGRPGVGAGPGRKRPGLRPIRRDPRGGRPRPLAR
jgi:hypothetical protein